MESHWEIRETPETESRGDLQSRKTLTLGYRVIGRYGGGRPSGMENYRETPIRERWKTVGRVTVERTP